MQRLREGGVYRLLNGREVVAGVCEEGRFALYSPLAWERSGVLAGDPMGLPDYEVDHSGVLHSGGEMTPMKIDDLIDTGRTASPRREGS